MCIEVSIIIPTLGEPSLRSTLEKCTTDNLNTELIIVDGSEEERAKPVAGDFNAKYIHQGPEGGPHKARELGALQAHGKYIQFLDDDDILLPGKLRKQIKLLESNDNIGVVYCGFRRNNRDTLPDQAVYGNVLKEALSISGLSVCSTSTMLIKSNIINDIIPFPNKHGADDTGMKIELAIRTEFDFISEVLVERGTPRRETSFANINGRKRIFEQYRDLYDQYPEEVLYQALASYYLRKGVREMEISWWSISAIYSLYNNLKYSWKADQTIITPISIFCVCLLGRPGWKVAKFIRRSI